MRPSGFDSSDVASPSLPSTSLRIALSKAPVRRVEATATTCCGGGGFRRSRVGLVRNPGSIHTYSGPARALSTLLARRSSADEENVFRIMHDTRRGGPRATRPTSNGLARRASGVGRGPLAPPRRRRPHVWKHPPKYTGRVNSFSTRNALYPPIWGFPRSPRDRA